MTSLDLHVHSCFSDGLLTPRELCALALKRRVRVLALCDHDTLGGLAPMAEAVGECVAEGGELRLIPAVEFSAGSDGRTHILGYGVRPDNTLLNAALLQTREHRRERLAEMLSALRRLGIDLPANLLPTQDDTGMPVGRPHVARALIATGVVNTMEQAFDCYLLPGRPAYVPLTHLSAMETAALLKASHAVPVLAHPLRMGLEPQALEALVTSLIPAGLCGIEAYHPSATGPQARSLAGMARRLNLLVTGGSDFHGDRGAHTQLGGLPAGWREWRNDLSALDAAITSQTNQPSDG